MLNDSNNDGDDGSCAQNLIDEIIKVLSNELQDTLDLWWWEGVLTVYSLSIGNILFASTDSGF